MLYAHIRSSFDKQNSKLRLNLATSFDDVYALMYHIIPYVTVTNLTSQRHFTLLTSVLSAARSCYVFVLLSIYVNFKPHFGLIANFEQGLLFSSERHCSFSLEWEFWILLWPLLLREQFFTIRFHKNFQFGTLFVLRFCLVQ